MNKYFKIFLIFSLVFLFSHQASAAGLVPCGWEGKPCTPCHLWDLANNVIKFIFVGLAIPILTVVMIWGGVLMMTGGADSIIEGKTSAGNITKGKKMLLSGVKGIFIAAGAWLIVTTIVNTFAAGKYTVKWANIECDLDSQPPPQPPVPPPGPVTPPPPPATALQCSASSVSPLITAIIQRVVQAAQQAGVPVNTPTGAQVSQGSHTCVLTNPTTGCSSPPCVSCHYGGTRCNGTGNAVDFSLASNRTPQNWERLLSVVQREGNASARCEMGQAPYIVPCTDSRVNHIHVNSGANCGCN